MRLLPGHSGRIGAILVGVLLVAGVIGPLVAPWEGRFQDIEAVVANRNRPLPPLSATHLLGTDILGRDILSRLLDGARVSLTVAIVVQIAAVVIGLPIGAAAGWFGGRVETLLMRFTDVIYAFPDLLFIIMVSVAFLDTPFGRWLDGLLVVFIAIALISWVTMARLVRGQVLALKHREFVEAARAIGLPQRRVLTRHILPNAVGPVIVAVSLGIPAAILAESTLSFLGLGVQPPGASWGRLIADGANYMDRYPWLVAVPAAALVLSLIGFTLLGESVREGLNPRAARR
jgi:oligopeptide transport system permease protein